MDNFDNSSEISNNIVNKLEQYDDVYYIYQPPYDKIRIISGIISDDINKENTYLIFVNNVNDGSIVDSIITKFDTLDHTVSTTYKPVSNADIIIVGADEDSLDKKLKNIKTNRNVILINDCTYVSKPTSVNKIKNKFGIKKVIHMALYERLSSSEKSDIIHNKVGFVNAELDKFRCEKLLIDGFLVNQDVMLNTEQPLLERLIYLATKKLDPYQDYKLLVVVKNAKDIEEIINKITSVNDELTIFNAYKYKIPEYIEEDVIITSNINDELLYKSNIKVFLLAEGACTSTTLYNLVSNFQIGYKYDNYRYMYIYDEPNDIKKSLLPKVINVSDKTLTSICRPDIEPITFYCDKLGNAEYPTIDIEEPSEYIDMVSEIICNDFKTKRDLTKAGLAPKYPELNIAVDSIIRAYNDYNINNGKYISKNLYIDIEQEKYYTAIGTHINSFTLPYYKFNGKTSKGVIGKILYSAIDTSYKYKREEIYSMISNDLQKDNFSYFKPIINKIIKKYRDTVEYDNETRKGMGTREVKIPFTELEIKKSDIIPTKKCGMTYCTKPKQRNEMMFLDFIDNHPLVNWWIKNGDHGDMYFNTVCEHNGVSCCFYPDWFVMLNSGILMVIDTKEGMTMHENGLTHNKIESLKQYNEKLFYGKLICGIVTNSGGEWLISDMSKEYEVDDKFSCFISLDELLKELSNG